MKNIICRSFVVFHWWLDSALGACIATTSASTCVYCDSPYIIVYSVPTVASTVIACVCVCTYICISVCRSDVFDTIQRGEREEAPVPAQRKEWVEVQKKTFTNWFRDRVRDNGCKPLTDIETDLEDGRLLIDLMRVLTEGARGRRT